MRRERAREPRCENIPRSNIFISFPCTVHISRTFHPPEGMLQPNFSNASSSYTMRISREQLGHRAMSSPSANSSCTHTRATIIHPFRKRMSPMNGVSQRGKHATETGGKRVREATLSALLTEERVTRGESRQEWWGKREGGEESRGWTKRGRKEGQARTRVMENLSPQGQG